MTAAGPPPNGVTGGFAGHCDWRLPTVVELQTIFDCRAGNPCIDAPFGPTASGAYWSSTDHSSSGPSLTWVVDFSDGSVGVYPADTGTAYVRAVRHAGP